MAFSRKIKLTAAVLFIALCSSILVHTMYGYLDAPDEGAVREARELFSEDYAQARAKFVATARAAQAELESYPLPSSGPNDERLFMDVAALGSPDATSVQFIGSGTHGVEGFAGSAIQIGLLRSEAFTKSLSNVRVVLIHAINPYGFAHLRRFNEGNVDLNRNFYDHENPYPSNPGYDALAEILEPASTSPPSDIEGVTGVLLHAATSGVGATKSAVTSGQYAHPRGLFYGGNTEAWSAKMLRTIVKYHAAGAQKVVFVDIHTGLGPYGRMEIILNVQQDDPAFRRARAWWGKTVKTTKMGDSVSQDLTGTLKLAIPKMLRSDAEVTAVSVEFGTVSSLKALLALREETWLHFHGGKNHSEAVRIKNRLLRAFYPDADDWRTAVWQQGRGVATTALERLTQ